MKSHFSRKSLALMGISILVLSVTLILGYEIKAQASATTSASAGWWSASASVTPSFNDDPELYPVNKMWKGRGSAEATTGMWGGSPDTGSIYVKIKTWTATSNQPGGSASTSYNYAYIKSRSQYKWAPHIGKSAKASGRFEGNALPTRRVTWP